MTITLQELIDDEQEAIRKYQAYLDQGVSIPSVIPVIKRIRDQEKNHLAILNKFKKRVK